MALRKKMTADFFADKAKDWDQDPSRIALIKKLTDFIRSRIKIGHETSVMDFGCGTGLIGLNFIDDCQFVVFVDTSPAMLAELSEKLKTHAQKTNFSVWDRDINGYDGKLVDLVISNNVLHHTPDVPTTIAGVYRAMNPGGHAVFLDFKTEDGSFHAPEIVPHNGFDPEEMKKTFEAAGFKNVEVSDYDSRTKPGTTGGRQYERWILFAEK